MKVKEGDVLVCKCKDCTIELTVTKACNPDACGVECDISASCCDGAMEIKMKYDLLDLTPGTGVTARGAKAPFVRLI